MKTSILASSRVGRAITEIAIRGVGAANMPIVVTDENDDIHTLDVMAAVAVALGYAAIQIDANDLTPADLSPRAQEYQEIVSRVQRRSIPPLFIVDVSDRAQLHLDDDQPQILALLAMIAAASWDGYQTGGIVFVTAKNSHDVARSLGTSLGRPNWDSFIPL